MCWLLRWCFSSGFGVDTKHQCNETLIITLISTMPTMLEQNGEFVSIACKITRQTCYCAVQLEYGRISRKNECIFAANVPLFPATICKLSKQMRMETFSIFVVPSLADLTFLWCAWSSYYVIFENNCDNIDKNKIYFSLSAYLQIFSTFLPLLVRKGAFFIFNKSRVMENLEIHHYLKHFV